MQEIADVYARSLFEVAVEHDALDDIHEQLDELSDALKENRDLRVYFFSPYFTSDEKKEGLRTALDDPDEHFANFLELLAEKHRLPHLHSIRQRFDALWAEERQVISVEVTSAIELEEDTLNSIGDRIKEETGREVDLSSRVDDDLIAGLVIRVGNMVLDSSVRNRLNKLRSEVASSAG